MNKIILPILAAAMFGFTSCKKDKNNTTNDPKLILSFEFDSTMTRLDSFGQPVSIGSGNAAQHPKMNSISAHYVELTPNATTLVGNGSVIYKADETTSGGANAINFQKAKLTKNNEVFLEVPLKNLTPGTYKYLRISVGYQNYDIKYRIDTTINGMSINQDFVGTLASFIGFNNYITNYKIKNQTENINGNKKQGYWAFESNMTIGNFPYNFITNGQLPEGAVTVVNPLHATSPIPANSCLVTSQFENNGLVISGNEKNNIKIKVKVSTNNSFEWRDSNQNGKFDPLKGEQVVDMGIRGMIPVIQ